jgi:hypothetical protein
VASAVLATPEIKVKELSVKYDDSILIPAAGFACALIMTNPTDPLPPCPFVI